MNDPAPASLIRVTVAYALPAQQWLVEVELPAGATVADALAASGLATSVPGWDAADLAYAIHAQLTSLDAQLADGDRVEVLRPLRIDPMQARRLRAQRRRI